MRIKFTYDPKLLKAQQTRHKEKVRQFEQVYGQFNPQTDNLEHSLKFAKKKGWK